MCASHLDSCHNHRDSFVCSIFISIVFFFFQFFVSVPLVDDCICSSSILVDPAYI